MFKHQLQKLKKLPFRSVGFWLLLALAGIVIYGFLLVTGVIDWFYQSPYNGERVGP